MEQIFDIASSLKTDSRIAIVSNIVPRGDKNKPKTKKAIKVINNVRVQCNIPVINHTNINLRRHLSRQNETLFEWFRKAHIHQKIKKFLKRF